jgi:hypothetical protein
VGKIEEILQQEMEEINAGIQIMKDSIIYRDKRKIQTEKIQERAKVEGK